MRLIWFPSWKAKQFERYGRRKCQVQDCISGGICCARLDGLSLVRNFLSSVYMYVISFSGNAKLRLLEGCRTCLFWAVWLSVFFPSCSKACLPCRGASQHLSCATRRLLPGLFPGNGSTLFQKCALDYSFGVKRGWSVGPLSYTSGSVFSG